MVTTKEQKRSDEPPDLLPSLLALPHSFLPPTPAMSFAWHRRVTASSSMILGPPPLSLPVLVLLPAPLLLSSLSSAWSWPRPSTPETNPPIRNHSNITISFLFLSNQGCRGRPGLRLGTPSSPAPPQRLLPPLLLSWRLLVLLILVTRARLIEHDSFDEEKFHLGLMDLAVSQTSIIHPFIPRPYLILLSGLGHLADPQVPLATADPIVPGHPLEIAAPVTGVLLILASIGFIRNRESQTGALLGFGTPPLDLRYPLCSKFSHFLQPPTARSSFSKSGTSSAPTPPSLPFTSSASSTLAWPPGPSASSSPPGSISEGSLTPAS